VPHVRDLLANVPAYIAFQRGIGADRLRYRCLEESAVKPGDTVLDIGCGPAYYLDRLPQPVTYFGFDTDRPSIDWARSKYGDRGTFHCGAFDAEQAARLPPVDVVLLLGLLHHLSDEDSGAVLDLIARTLAPGGRVVSVDTCFEPVQGRVSRWVSESDRGEYVRPASEFAALAQAGFEHVEVTRLSHVLRMPAAFCMMRMTQPRPPVRWQPRDASSQERAAG
jgi:SAM-dependent methyltransferase